MQLVEGLCSWDQVRVVSRKLQSHHHFIYLLVQQLIECEFQVILVCAVLTARAKNETHSSYQYS